MKTVSFVSALIGQWSNGLTKLFNRKASTRKRRMTRKREKKSTERCKLNKRSIFHAIYLTMRASHIWSVSNVRLKNRNVFRLSRAVEWTRHHNPLVHVVHVVHCLGSWISARTSAPQYSLTFLSSCRIKWKTMWLQSNDVSDGWTNRNGENMKLILPAQSRAAMMPARLFSENLLFFSSPAINSISTVMS